MAVTGRRERKVVSVLFADLVGFTSRADSLDPEDVEAILTPYHAHLRAELERFGGSVEKFIGDAVVAVFGAPVAHEDDAERAVRAALAIRDWAREDEAGLELRIAVNTGEALVSLDADPASGEHALAGDVVNTASRLQAAAPVNGVLVGEPTYRATERTVDYREVEAVAAKGKADPVRVWEALEARSRFGSDVTHRTRTPLVGRERELAVLSDALARAREARAPQLVTLVGVPGIGKSRLVHELSRLVDADPELLSWRQGRCLPYGEGVAFWALAEMIKAQAGILEGDPASTAQERLSSAVAAAIAETGDAEWVLEHLRPLLGLGERGEGGADARTESFAAWRRFLEALAEQRPLVLVFEDLHWADDGLLDFVDHLVDWATGVPVLVVGTARPELLTRRPGWGGGKPNSVTLSLSPLSERDTAQLLHGLLDRSVLPVEIHSLLLERAGGNPLYAEEFARIAGEGRADLPLPESVQGLIAARLDALPGEEKHVLQDAAVVGKVFWLGAVGALGGDGSGGALEGRLHALERKEFVRRERRTAVAGDTQYAFGHALVRDVAYAQIPRAGRAEKHRRAAEWIEALGRPEDHAEMRAHHYVSAVETGQAAGQDMGPLVEAARGALREAGDRAVSLNSFRAAARLYDRALALGSDDDAGRVQLRFAAAVARFEQDLDNDEELAAVRDDLLAAGEREDAARAEIMIANVLWVRGRGEETPSQLERAAAAAAELPRSPAKAFVLAGLSRFHMLADRDEVATMFAVEALALADELGLELIRANALNNLGTMKAGRGDRSGFEQLEQSIAIAEALNSPHAVRAYNNLSYCLYRLGELGRAAEVAERMEVLAERFAGDWLWWARDRLVHIRYEDGRWDEALRLVESSVAESATSRHYLEPSWREVRARIRLARGDDAGAGEDSTVALERARLARDAQLVVPVLALRARVVVDDAPDEADALIDELHGLTTLAWAQMPHAWYVDVVEVGLKLGRTALAEDLAAASPAATRWVEAGLTLLRGDPAGAAEQFAAFGSRPNEANARVRSASLLLAEGRRAEADAQLQRALAFFREVGATAYARDAEALLRASA
jgi:class 3 adenylate cyclase/tetratricopeptide (TPR) repeat protein